MQYRITAILITALSFAFQIAAAQPHRVPPHLGRKQAARALDAKQKEAERTSDNTESSRQKSRMPPRPRSPHTMPGMPMQFMTLEQQDSLLQARKEMVAKDRARVAGFGANFIRLYPFHLMDQITPGIGLEYERLIGKKRYIGFTLPISLTAGSEPGFYVPIDDNPFVIIAPGIKIYPAGQRKVTYALGPSLFLGIGRAIYKEYSGGIPIGRSGESITRYKMGFLINNYLHVQGSKRLSFAMTLGFGYKFFNNAVFSDGSFMEYGERGAAHLSVGIGYRFK